MRIGKTTFTKYGKRIYITNGRDPLKYFDLSKLKLVKYKGPISETSNYTRLFTFRPQKDVIIQSTPRGEK